MSKTLLYLIGILLITATATATDHYVATTGDNNDVGDLSNPWQNVSYATQQAVAGDTIYLINGTWYDEHVIFANSGNATHIITLTAFNGTPTLDGGDKTGVGLMLNAKSYITISGLKIIKYYTCANIGYNSASHNTLSNCELGDTGEVVVRMANGDTTNNTLENCTLYGSGWNTVQLVSTYAGVVSNATWVTDIIIRDNEIYNSNAHSAIDFYGEFRKTLIEGNHIHSSSGGDIYFHDLNDYSEYVTIKNNMFNDSYYSPISWERSTGGTTPHDLHHVIRNNTFTNITSKAPIALVKVKNITVDLNSFYNTLYPVQVSGSTTTEIIASDNYVQSDGDKYLAQYGGSFVVNNPAGLIELWAYDNATIELRFDDATAFSASASGNYVSWTPVRYYPVWANCSIISVSDDSAYITSVETHNITIVPVNNYLENIVVNQDSNSTHDLTNVTIDSSVTSNPTWINATMHNATNTYNISIDGGYVAQVESGVDKVVRYQYAGSWGPHTFEFAWASNDESSESGDANAVWIESNIDLTINETTSIPTYIENATGISGVSMTINYNSSVIEIVGGEMGDFTWNHSIRYDDTENGTASVVTLIAAQALTGNLTIGFIVVQAIGDIGDSSHINITNVVLCGDYGNYIIPDTIINGSVILSGTILGDADGNGVVNTLDVLMILQYLLYHNTTSIDLEAADVCGNEGVDIADATLILSHCTDPAEYPLAG